MEGKLICVEGTDCSGKQTQTELLKTRLENDGYKVAIVSFPNYNSPTGKIIGGPYLGKSYICDGWFPEGAANVPAKVASLYYAADRLYNVSLITDKLKEGYIVLLDRYMFSNMAHQGGKISNKKEREEMYEWLEKLEFDFLELPRIDYGVFLHVPYEVSLKLKQERVEALDQHERSKENLIGAETAYLEIAEKYNFKTIECSLKGEMLSIEEINDKLYEIIKKVI